MEAHNGQLPAPLAADRDRQAREVLRAWIVEGGLQVSLKTSFETPQAWGILLMDVARHVARAYALEGFGTEAAVMATIKGMFDAEWDRPTDVGATSAAH